MTKTELQKLVKLAEDANISSKTVGELKELADNACYIYNHLVNTADKRMIFVEYMDREMLQEAFGDRLKITDEIFKNTLDWADEQSNLTCNEVYEYVADTWGDNDEC